MLLTHLSLPKGERVTLSQLPTKGEDILTQDGQGSVGLVLYFLWTSLGLI